MDQVANRYRPNLWGEGSKDFARKTPKLFFPRSLGRVQVRVTTTAGSQNQTVHVSTARAVLQW